jgi:hypothetical protein
MLSVVKEAPKRKRSQQELIDLFKQVGSDGKLRYRVNEVADTAAIVLLGSGKIDVKELDPSSRALVLGFARRLGVSAGDSAVQLQTKAVRYFSDHSLPQELLASLAALLRKTIAMTTRGGQKAQAEPTRQVGDKLEPVASSVASARGAGRSGKIPRSRSHGLVRQKPDRKHKSR